MNYFRKALSYGRECCFCLKTGVSVKDKLRLVGATLAFHVNKRKGRPPTLIEARVHIGSLTPRLRLRDSGGDLFIFHEVLGDQVYKVDPGWLVSEPRTIIDLGGNMGLASMALATQFPKARIIAVEPQPDCVALLKHNVQCLGERAHVWEAAVSDHSGTMRLALADEHYNASLVRSAPKGIDVRTVTVDEILASEAITVIDIMKIDIEGAEMLILRGSPDWLKKVNLMLIELHEGYDFDRLSSDLAPAGLQVFRRGGATAIARRI